ncbi:MAG: hypothetical protein IPF92_31095 [Myxococcales bacterium]|nr:hypothetical protein [Myxococcales bacterium]
MSVRPLRTTSTPTTPVFFASTLVMSVVVAPASPVAVASNTCTASAVGPGTFTRYSSTG